MRALIAFIADVITVARSLPTAPGGSTVNALIQIVASFAETALSGQKLIAPYNEARGRQIKSRVEQKILATLGPAGWNIDARSLSNWKGAHNRILSGRNCRFQRDF